MCCSVPQKDLDRLQKALIQMKEANRKLKECLDEFKNLKPFCK